MYLISEKQSHGRGVIGSKPPGQLVTHSGLNIALPTLSSELPLPSFLDVFKYRGIVFPSLYIQRYSFFFFYWGIVDLLCCINLCFTVKWFSCTYMYILFCILFHYGLLQDIEYSSLCYTLGLCSLSSLYIIICIL